MEMLPDLQFCLFIFYKHHAKTQTIKMNSYDYDRYSVFNNNDGQDDDNDVIIMTMMIKMMTFTTSPPGRREGRRS